MTTDVVRVNISLSRDLAESLDRIAGPRKRSAFIAEAIRQLLERNAKEALDRLLSEGYRANKSESLSLTKEFETSDLEGWDEY